MYRENVFQCDLQSSKLQKNLFGGVGEIVDNVILDRLTRIDQKLPKPKFMGIYLCPHAILTVHMYNVSRKAIKMSTKIVNDANVYKQTNR